MTTHNDLNTFAFVNQDLDNYLNSLAGDSRNTAVGEG